MASKVPLKNIVSFMDLRKRCPKNQIHHLDKFCTKHQEYQERLRTLRKNPPTIDWDYYKRNVRTEFVPMVEEFEKLYSNFCIPYPEDNYSKEIDKLRVDLKEEIAEFVRKSNERIAIYEKKMEEIRNTLPYDQMTWEDYCNLYPEDAPDFINRPTFWPHTEEEKIDIVSDLKEDQEKIKEGENETKETKNLP